MLNTLNTADTQRTMRSAPSGARVASRDGTATSVAPATVLGAIGFVIFWSLTYLLRQPGVADAAARPFSLLGDFALEGAVLALSWLALLVCACLALMRGAIVLRSDG